MCTKHEGKPSEVTGILFTFNTIYCISIKPQARNFLLFLALNVWEHVLSVVHASHLRTNVSGWECNQQLILLYTFCSSGQRYFSPRNSRRSIPPVEVWARSLGIYKAHWKQKGAVFNIVRIGYWRSHHWRLSWQTQKV